MSDFGTFYLDKEKDVIVHLEMDRGKMTYLLETPNHRSGNLIVNFASVCGLPLSFGENGLYVIRGEVPCYYDGDGSRVYTLRMGNTKVANLYPDGSILRKAYIPAIAKTLMSQTKSYHLDISKTLVKTYILEDIKFHSDLHTHRNAILSPDLLIALAVHHQLRYPYYYIKKLGLSLTEDQKTELEFERARVAEELKDSELSGKYLERRIDDNTEINFARLMLDSPELARHNIPLIRASLTVMKDGQAVFTDLEKVYMYRYVFTKGAPAKKQMTLTGIENIPDADIVRALHRMEQDRKNPAYRKNSLYQDKLLWTARSYAKSGIDYAEISDTALVKEKEAAATLKEIHGVMPAVTAETGVTLRFLAALRRIPLTLGRSSMSENSFNENLRVLRAIASDPYVAGCDFVGEEINDIRELSPVIAEVVKLAKEIPSFVIRIHAGENDSLPDNVYNSVRAVEEALDEGQAFPKMRIGHGLYTAKLSSAKGRALLSLLRERGAVLEFQITSNVRLNNLSQFKNHPLKQYLNADVLCVQGTDGGALYGTDSVDEELSLERFLELGHDDILKMRHAEEKLIAEGLQAFEEKTRLLEDEKPGDIERYYNKKIAAAPANPLKGSAERGRPAQELLGDCEKELPDGVIPIVIAGGSFNNASRKTRLSAEGCGVLDALVEKGDPSKICFVIGPSLTGYEKAILARAKDRFPVYAFSPAEILPRESKKLREAGVGIRIAIEPAALGVYKSIAYEIFKRRSSVLLVLDGNSAAANLIQDAKNSRYKTGIFISGCSRELRSKAESLAGYVTLLAKNDKPESVADKVLEYVDRYYQG